MIVRRLLLVLVSTACGLGIGELALRVVFPGNVFLRGATQLAWDSDNPLRRVFVSHPQLGFVPVLGGDTYNAVGTKHNDYPIEKPLDKERLLFVGDSVTARSRIIWAIQQLAGDERYEYWNAGVEGYNTVQEVALYRDWNASIRPDHVILTFHNNDFDITPVTFVDGDGRLVVFAPHVPLEGYSPGLFSNSYIYRLVLSRLGVGDEDANRSRITRDSLAELKTLVEAEGARLTVVLFPVLRAPETWNAQMSKSRERSLKVLDALHLRTFDLMTPLEQMIADGVPLEQAPGDVWHPSKQAAAGFADWLMAHDLLGTTPPPR